MERIFVVLIPVDYSNSRKVCELIENQKYENLTSVSDSVKENGIVSTDEESGDVLYFELTDFMDEVNNQTLDNLSEYFISYVKVLN